MPKRPNCFMPACGIDGKLCPDCAAAPAQYELTPEAKIAAYQDGFAEGTAMKKRGHYRDPQPGEIPEWRTGYEAGWEAEFWAKHRKTVVQPALF